jgi:hypothetical protein
MSSVGWLARTAGSGQTRPMQPRRRAWAPVVCLAAVCVVYVVLQVAWVGRVPLGWDESVYVSQVDPRLPTLEFSAPRSRGVSLLALPLEALTGSLTALRVYLAALSGLGLFVAYAAWFPLVRRFVPPLAALLLVTLWTTVFYGAAAMPNVPVALAAVAAVAWFLRAADTGSLRLLVALAAAIALAALLRPGDAAPLAVALAAAALVHPTWRPRWRPLLAAVLGGAALGALPWVVEAQLRYGDVFSRLRRALAAQSTGQRFVPDYQLRSLDGPILCRPCLRALEPIPLSGVLWWSVAAVLVVGGLVLAHRRGAMGPPLLATVVAAASAGPYLLLVGYAAPRFLLPAYALLAVPAALCLEVALAAPRPRLRTLVVAGVVLLLGLHVVAQARILDRIVAAQRADRARWVSAAADLARLGVRPPCTLTGSNATPVARVAGCDSVKVGRLRGDEDFRLADLQAVRRQQGVALVQRPGTARPTWARDWRRVPVRELPHTRGLAVYLPPGQG